MRYRQLLHLYAAQLSSVRGLFETELAYWTYGRVPRRHHVHLDPDVLSVNAVLC